MSLRELQAALKSAGQDDALVTHFVTIWPLIEGILEAFSKATALPIFAFLDGTKVFQSSLDTMPPFCREMLKSRHMASRCIADGQNRAAVIAPRSKSFRGDIQLCHAGMVNGRFDVDTVSLGTLSVLFGSKKAVGPEETARRETVIQTATNADVDLGDRLRRADATDTNTGDIGASNLALMHAITGVIERLIAATVGFRSLTINMAHELCLMMVGMGFLAQETVDIVESDDIRLGSASQTELSHHGRLMVNQCNLGLYVVRNFLSHASETRYAEVLRPRFADVDLAELLRDIIDLHRPAAAQKNLTIDFADTTLPKIKGLPLEIQRLFHNVLNNAIKYSYHSIPEAHRVIRIRFQIPYDPGFAARRFAVVVENYGLGLTPLELRRVFSAGFRGAQAAAEVPIGSGIGLSESLKIMKVHGGSIKMRSRAVHEAADHHRTYLTSVSLIFPYRDVQR